MKGGMGALTHYTHQHTITSLLFDQNSKQYNNTHSMSALGKRTRAPAQEPVRKRTCKGETKEDDTETYPAKGAVYTFAGVVENHAGMEKIGTERDALTEEELIRIAEFAQENGYDIEAINLRGASKLKKKSEKRMLMRKILLLLI